MATADHHSDHSDQADRGDRADVEEACLLIARMQAGAVGEGPLTRQSDVPTGYSSHEAWTRFTALSLRDTTARAVVIGKARGTWSGTGDDEELLVKVAADNPPLTEAEHLELLVLGEYLARGLRNTGYVDRALKAGATWAQIAAAVDQEEHELRQRYRDWADGQRRLAERRDWTVGMSAEEHAAAIARAEAP